LGTGVDFNIPRQKTERNMGIGLSELEIFLIGKGFDGASIDDFFALTGPMLDGKLGGKCFSRTRMRSNQNMLVLENALDGIFLEIT
jgi:hypothetical protein